MLDTKRNLIIFRKKGGGRRRPGIIRMIKTKLL